MTQMVLSFSRPDPSSPSAVAGATFGSARRGFDPSEVRDFLRMVSAEMARLQERVVFLERELKDSKHNRPMVTSEMTEATIAGLLGEETARIVEAAREAAHKIKLRSEESAGRIVREASEEAARIREETELECSRRRQDATSDAEAEILMAKQQGREMVNEARSYRERVLADVGRRREMAREQIEDLHHSRERLVHAFERARTATDEVLRDLVQPSDEPMEYVNLAPTTGPVPVIVQADDIDRTEAIRSQSTAPAYSDEEIESASPPVSRGDDIRSDLARRESERLHPAWGDAAIVDIRDSDVHDSDATDSNPPVGERDDTADLDIVVDRVTVIGETPDIDEVDSEPVSNVVPLFSRTEGRITEPSMPEPELGEDPTSPEPVVEPRKRRSRPDAGDIFEKIRQSSTESVAEDATRHLARAEKPTRPSTRAIDTIEPRIDEELPGRTEPVRERPVAERGEHDDHLFAVRNEVLVPVIVAMSRMTKRILADEQNQVLDILRGKPVVRRLDALVGSRAEHAGRYVAALSNLLGEAALAGARSLSDEPERVLVGLIETQTSMIHEFVSASLVDPLRERLERSMSQSGESNAELASLVRLVYREWKNHYIDEHMDDVALTAYGRGAASVLKQSMRVCWMVDPNGPPCADAEDNSLGGYVRGGEEFPTGHTHAPAHAGCRCVLATNQN